jgi:hypothetical protein
MSDFLFRMVERAAGLATATTPQPPRTFPWMSPAETLPSHFPSASAWEAQASAAPSPLRQPPAKFDRVMVEDHRNVDVQPSPQPSVRGASSFPLENVVSETIQQLIQPSLAVQSKPHRAVKAGSTKETAPRSQNRLPENTEQTGHKVNVSHLQVEAAPSKRQPLAKRPDGPIIAGHEAAYFPLEEPAQKTSIHTARPATPLPRENKTPVADMRTPKPASESPVEVKIGRVEIHFDAPATPAASPAPARPGGFNEYAELRRYASRKR